MTQHDDFAYRLTSVLDRDIKEMDAPTLRQLATIRQKAISSHHHPAFGHHVVALIQRHSLVSMLLVLVLMLAGLWLAQNSRPPYSAETDILLLTGELPPNTYADKTFTQWLDARTTF